MKQRIALVKLIACTFLSAGYHYAFTQAKKADSVKLVPAPVFGESNIALYQHTNHPDAQWYPKAGFGMFIHWSIASVKQIDLSWPMMAGTQIGWRPASDRLDSVTVKKIMDSGNYFAGHECEAGGNCITPNEYFALAKYFGPKNFDADKIIKAARDAGMTYAVFTAKHHDGFAMWPSGYGDFNTKSYLGSRDFVKEFVTACRKYGLKVGLYFSPPDWHFDPDFQNFMYYGLAKRYPNIPVLDRNLQPRTNVLSAEDSMMHYRKVAAYVKGQVEELLTSYGKIDMIWFDTDGVPIIPKGHLAWKDCITMERVRELQPGIIVSPRLFGYGDYKTFESDKNFPTVKQDGWAEFCTTIATNGWGYTPASLKSSGHVLNYLVKSKAYNMNMLLNYGPDKNGVLSPGMYKSLTEIAGWMKINGASVNGAHAIDSTEYASVPATQTQNYRYLFLLAPGEKIPVGDEMVVFSTDKTIKAVRLLASKKNLSYLVEKGKLTIEVPAGIRSKLPDVIEVQLK
ncbi:alpha-L-fucosidase [Chitinophagaceae bacterium 26-R-25]|nr:alpha-L-fucosidase [Chitinophagaceae bacterium 26-R-25]